MKTITILLIVYASLVVICFALAIRRRFHNKEGLKNKIGKDVLNSFIAALFFPIVIYMGIKALYYRNRPRPIPKKQRKWFKSDRVYYKGKLMSLAEYNATHKRQFTLEQVYGKKYVASLSEEDRDSFTLMNVLLTKDVWERYRDHLMPALARADWDFLNNVLEGSFSFDPDDLEKPCELPCLIIAAKQDSEVGYKDQFDLMKIYTNSTYCAIDRAGHNFPIEQPQIFESVFYSWLSSNT